jgi:hypothetical protein
MQMDQRSIVGKGCCLLIALVETARLEEVALPRTGPLRTLQKI